MFGGPQPYATNSAASDLGIAVPNLPGADKLPGLGTDLVKEVEEAEKLKQKKVDTLSPASAALLAGGV